jgi:2-phosphosulfolactate phosphatase
VSPPGHAVAEWATQTGFDVRLAWGPEGIGTLAGGVATVVLVDVLRFTTALDVATARGAAVHPARWPFDREVADDADGADGSAVGTGSLSPGSLAAVTPGDRIVLPSQNGSHCSAVAAATGRAVVGACLRNAAAVGSWLLPRDGPVAVIACGERRPDGSLRPAVEDLIGAGAVVAALGRGRSCSPEADAARAGFVAAAADLNAVLWDCESGRELRAKGLADDIAWAAASAVSSGVPVLGADGAYRAASALQGR